MVSIAVGDRVTIDWLSIHWSGGSRADGRVSEWQISLVLLDMLSSERLDVSCEDIKRILVMSS
jgi:hypothetical protein